MSANPNAERYDDEDDRDLDLPPPWEIGEGMGCSCELMLTECDASDRWCHWHDQYRAAWRQWSARSEEVKP